MHRVRRWLLGLMILGALLWATTAGAVLWAAAQTLETHRAGRAIEPPVDAVIVLGAGIDRHGRLNEAGMRRVAAAVQAFEAGRAAALIVSGGSLGKSRVPVGALMGEHAIRLGVPADRVLAEGRARSTFQNLIFSFEIADRHGMERLALASDAYHLTRARMLAGVLGRPGVALVAAAGPSTRVFGWQGKAILREALAWWYNLGKVVAWEGLDALGWQPAERRALVG